MFYLLLLIGSINPVTMVILLLLADLWEVGVQILLATVFSYGSMDWRWQD
jgi:hypothetical protein